MDLFGVTSSWPILIRHLSKFWRSNAEFSVGDMAAASGFEMLDFPRDEDN